MPEKGGEVENYYSAEEFAKAVDVSVDTVWRWLKSGKINGKKFGKFWRIEKDELLKVLPQKK